MGISVRCSFLFICLFLCISALSAAAYPVVHTRDVRTGLNSPTVLLWGPDSRLWLAEREGAVSRIDPETGEIRRILAVPNVFVHDGAGLLGMTLHPGFADTPHVFVAYTYVQMGVEWKFYLRVARYRYDAVRDTLVEPVVLLDKIDAGYYAVGGRLLALPDRTLLLTLGDGLEHSERAPDLNSTRGKTLRMRLDGSVPADNPWGNLSSPFNLIWTKGHRNVEGIALGPDNMVYGGEIGPGMADELNAVVKGRDYGWPGTNGYRDEWPGPEYDVWRERNIPDPVYEWYRGRRLAVVPAGLAYYPQGVIEQWKNSLLVATLEDGLYQLALRDDKRGVTVAYHFLFSNADKNRYGALRDVCVSPSGRIFVISAARPNGASSDKLFEILSSDFEPHSDGVADVTAHTVRDGLKAPWQLAWAADSAIWMTERPGYLTRHDLADGTVQTVADMRDVVTEGEEAGLLGVALHPDFPDTAVLFLSYTYHPDAGGTFLRVARYRYDEFNARLADPFVLLDSIPASAVRNGGRLQMENPGTLLLAVGDAGEPAAVADGAGLRGKILRIRTDGTVPEDNPDAGDAWPRGLIWATGVRAPQGLVHAPSGLRYGIDASAEGGSELNLYYAGGNYGWPFLEGFCDGAPGQGRNCIDSGAVEPLRTWSSAVGGIAYYGSAGIRLWNNSLLAAMTGGEELRQIKLSDDGLLIEAENSFFRNEFGRLRDVCVTGNGRVFIATGNTPVGGSGADRLIEVKSAPDTTIGDESDLHVRTVTEGLDTPWEIVWGPDEWLWITERPGWISRVNPVTGQKRRLADISPNVHEFAGSGMLGLALHPQFDVSPFVYVVYTYSINRGTPDEVMMERLERYRYDAVRDTLTDPFVMIDSIVASIYHDGSRLLFLPDRTLLMTTGDAADITLPQDHTKLNGKVLRINPDGTVPADNPWAGAPWPSSLLWSTGHRNPQGLALAANGLLYSSEHGDDADDEMNIIYKGRNYGYPFVRGICDDTVNYDFDPTESIFCGDSSTVQPFRTWTPTLGVCGLAYYDHEAIPQWRGSLLLVTLGIKKPVLPLYANTMIQMKLTPDGLGIEYEKNYFTQQFGRLRAVCVAPDGRVFIASSNEDSRGEPRPGGDRILEIRGKLNSSVPSHETGALLAAVVPHPVRAESVVEFERELKAGTVRVYDITGSMVRSEEFGGGDSWRFVRGNLAAGVYMIEIADAKNVLRARVMVE